MPEEKKSSSSTSVLGTFLGIASLSAGAYHGYCNAKGIPISQENLEFALTWGPAIIQGATYGIIGGLAGLTGGAIIGTKEYNSHKITGGIVGGLTGAISGGAVGGIAGGAAGGLETLFGYGIGYLAGLITK